MEKVTKSLIRIFLCASIVQSCLGQVAAPLVIPEGTKVRVRLDQQLSSATTEEGQPVQLAVGDDVVIDGVVAIPKDSVVNGTVVQSVAKRRMGRTGKLDLSIDHIVMPEGRLPLRYSVVKKEGGSKAVSTGVITAGVAVAFFPAAPFVLLRKGKDTVFSKGMSFEVFTETNYTAKPKHTGPMVAAMADLPALTNDEVLALKHAGFSDQVILARIAGAPGAYTLDMQSLIALKEAGLSDEVITAMVGRLAGKQ